MNQAGIMKAQFSNSLFLVAEKGGFTFPDAPTGLSLLSAVGGNGPLVTSISVNVSEGGISTTVSMDTYSTKFGELNKQQQEKFAIINKQVQKLKDMQNLSIRNSVTKKNLSDFSKRVGSNIKELYKPSIQKQTTEYQVLVAQAVPKVDENGNRTVENACSLQSQDYYNTNNNYFDKNHFNADQQNCGGQYFSEFYTPYSTAPYHPNMPYAIYLNKQAIDERMDS
jgi:hypothetical protein